MLMKTTTTKERDHLTDAKVRALVAPAGRHNKVYYDDTGFGFGCRVTRNGAKSFILNYWTKAGRERRHTIGRFPTWSTAAARERARELKQEIDRGADPMAEIEAERAAPTVDDLCDRFEQEYLPKKSEHTARDYAALIRLYIRPALKNLKVAEVAFSDVERLHRRITAQGSPYQANRTIAVASKMFSQAQRWKMGCEVNPCRGIERNREDSRRRYASNEELERLMAALTKDQNQQAANVIRICLLTGCRVGEARSMHWKSVDLAAGTWSKPPAGTKSRRHHSVPLSPPARQLLAGIAEKYRQEHPGQPLPTHVFHRGHDGHLVELKKDWARVCKAAKVADLRVHDLRHTFASQLASSGASLMLIGSLLGHSSPATTHRYAHLFPDAEREAVARVGAIITNVGKPVKAPTKLPKRRR
jgi:integrase